MLGVTKKFWDAVNGHKTALGVLAYFTGKVLVSVGFVAGEIMTEAGQWVMGMGLAHKAGKEFKKRKNGKS